MLRRLWSFLSERNKFMRKFGERRKVWFVWMRKLFLCKSLLMSCVKGWEEVKMLIMRNMFLILSL